MKMFLLALMATTPTALLSVLLTMKETGADAISPTLVLKIIGLALLFASPFPVLS